jgi:Transposase DDE domain
MSRRTNGKPSAGGVYPAQLREAIARFLPHRGLPVLCGKKQLCWAARMLVVCAILVAWDASGTLSDRFHAARQVVVKMFPTRRRPGKTCTGFWAALARHSDRLLGVIAPALRQRVRVLAGREHWRVGRWAAFGVDGSRVECRMTAANEKAFGTAGKDKTGPQQFLTTVFHVGTGLVWDWRRGPARDSERGHLLQMLGTLPPGALLLADAGFTGYELMRQVTGTGRSLLIRVGSNVRLLRKLGLAVEGHEGVVYLWPDKAQKRRQLPLILRLITLCDGRNRKVHLLTDVLDRELLSDAEASALYRRRWTVELLYRSLKQTMGNRKLRCGTPRHAAAELDWAVAGLWVLGLMSVGRLTASGRDPGDWSVAAALRVVRRAMAGTLGVPLDAALAAAAKDEYRRTGSKKARHWPHKKRQKPPGNPKARNAKKPEKQLAAELLAEQRAAA